MIIIKSKMSRWQNTIEDYTQYLETVDSDSIILETKTNMLLNKLYHQLVIDNQAFELNKTVSDCAKHTPSLRGKLDKRNKFAHKLCAMIFPHEEEDKIHAYIRYGRLLKNLRTKYTKQVIDKEKKRLEDKKAQIFIDSCLLEKPISDTVINPAAMPVKVASWKQLQPFFEYMQKGVAADKSICEFTRGVHYDDGRIDLCKQVVGSKWIVELLESIKNNPHVNHFLLGNNIVDMVGAKAIATFISTDNVCKIKTWYIAGNRINTEGIKLIADSLKHDTFAEALWLKRNPLMPDGGMHIGEMLKVNNTLQILDLENTGLLDEGIEYLMLGLKQNTRLRKLYLGSNGITAEGAKYFADYFETLTTEKRKGITSLYLGCNRLTDTGIQFLAEALENYPYLKRLAVGSNRITHIGANVLFEKLEKSVSLISLSLGFPKATFAVGEVPNLVNDQGADQIAKFIQNNKSVKFLNFSNNNMTNSGIKIISEAMQYNDTLLDMKYDHFRVKLDAEIVNTIQNKLRTNIKNSLNMEQKDMYKKYLRFVKHTKKVANIDSIYRTRDFK